MDITSKHYRQQIKEIEKANKEANYGKTGKPYFGYIVTNNPHEEELQLGGAMATRVPTLHPYIGVDSWIRVSPNAATGVIVSSRDDTANVTMISYDTGISKSRFDRYNKYQNLYRPLDSGEIEIVSTGKSYTWWGNESYICGSGMVSMIMDKKDLTITTRSALHKTHLHDNTIDSAQLSKFGVVIRNKKPIKKTNTEIFAKEFGILFDDIKLLMGDIFDDEGNVVKYDNKELILDSLLGKGMFKLDKEGNALIQLKNRTITGNTFYDKLTKYRLTCDDAIFKASINLKGNKLKIDSTKTEITSTSTEIKSTSIKLGTATDPMVLGNAMYACISELATALSGGNTLGEVKPAIALWGAKWGVPTSLFLSQSQKVSI